MGLVKKGSLTKTYQACRNPNCRCSRDPKLKHGPYFLLTTKSRAKTKTFSVPEDVLEEIKTYIYNYKLLISKVKMVEEISEKIIKIRIKKHREELNR